MSLSSKRTLWPAQRAPAAIYHQKRAVTPEDYASMAQRHPEVKRAAATLCWTGSWHAVLVSIERADGRPVDRAFREKMLEFLERFRLAGCDLEILPLSSETENTGLASLPERRT